MNGGKVLKKSPLDAQLLMKREKRIECRVLN